jgi:hypothetical protein
VALLKCGECGKEHSDSVAACPHCGFKRPKKVGVLGIVFAGVLGLAVYQCNSPTSVQVAKSPEQVAAEAKKEAAFQRVVAAMQIVIDAARNPESVKWDTVLANDDASVICLGYRAQNGFGGMNKEIVVVAKGTASQKAAVWNRHCLTQLNDMKYAVHAL